MREKKKKKNKDHDEIKEYNQGNYIKKTFSQGEEQRAATKIWSAAKRALYQAMYNELLEEVKQDIAAAYNLNSAVQASIQWDRYAKTNKKNRNYNH